MTYIYKIFIIIFVLLSTSCEGPFNTKPTEDDVFELTANHNITRLMPSAEINLTWNETTVEQFAMYRIERMRTNDTLWTSIVDLSDPFQLSYTDTIFDDENLIYRIGIFDVEDNVLWATESISIPKITSVLVPTEFRFIQPAFDSELIDDGDTIMVNVGTYEETLSIAGKDVLIISTGNYNDGMMRISSRNVLSGTADRYKETVLMPTYHEDPSKKERVLNISSGIVDGFTIKEGAPSYGAFGGGVSIAQTGTVQNCFITENFSQGMGGGVFITDDGNLYNNIIYQNVGFAGGNGIFVFSNHGEIINNTIFGNNIVISGNCEGLLIRNNIINNSQPDITFTDQTSLVGVIIDYSLLDTDIAIDSETNIIAINPEFHGFLDFNLLPSSPCIDAGHPGNQYFDTDDSRNDMGFYGGPRAR